MNEESHLFHTHQGWQYLTSMCTGKRVIRNVLKYFVNDILFFYFYFALKSKRNSLD